MLATVYRKNQKMHLDRGICLMLFWICIGSNFCFRQLLILITLPFYLRAIWTFQYPKICCELGIQCIDFSLNSKTKSFIFYFVFAMLLHLHSSSIYKLVIGLFDLFKYLFLLSVFSIFNFLSWFKPHLLFLEL